MFPLKQFPKISEEKKFVNMYMKNFNYTDFHNICRACMSEGELQLLQDGHMKVLNLISKVQYSKTDELPQKICERCVKKINDIMSFALLCKRIDQTLKKYLENFKIENISMDLTPLESARIKSEEITIVEEKIEFIDVNETIDLDTNHVKIELERLKDELIRAELEEEERARAMAIAAANAPTPDVSAPTADVPAPTADVSAPTPDVSALKALPQLVEQRSRTGTPRPFKCAYCARTFTTAGKKRAHERLVHNVTVPKHKCYNCATVYKSASALTEHKKTHRRYQCDVCDLFFRSKNQLQKHGKTHQDEIRLDVGQPYECLICFKRFYLLTSYLKHNSVHGTFECDMCSKVCAGAASLERHKRTHKRKNKKK